MRLPRPGGRNQKIREQFEPTDRERSLVDPWINNRSIPFIGREGERGLKDLIMREDRIDEDKKSLIVEWAQRERGLRTRPSGERPEF